MSDFLDELISATGNEYASKVVDGMLGNVDEYVDISTSETITTTSYLLLKVSKDLILNSNVCNADNPSDILNDFEIKLTMVTDLEFDDFCAFIKYSSAVCPNPIIGKHSKINIFFIVLNYISSSFFTMLK